jgi:hypothetical protein
MKRLVLKKLLSHVQNTNPRIWQKNTITTTMLCTFREEETRASKQSLGKVSRI